MKEGFSAMDTQQNTPVHQHLWNRDFGLLVIADLLVAMGVYMQMVYVSAWHTPEGSGDNTLVWPAMVWDYLQWVDFAHCWCRNTGATGCACSRSS